MSVRITNQELNDRAAKRAENKSYWKLCQKCKENQWERQYCKCPACSKQENTKMQMFVHLNEKNPFTIDWNSYDQDTDSYESGISDTWQLCDSCSRKLQVYANWN